jgi:WD40 repeat protein
MLDRRMRPGMNALISAGVAIAIGIAANSWKRLRRHRLIFVTLGGYAIVVLIVVFSPGSSNDRDVDWESWGSSSTPLAFTHDGHTLITSGSFNWNSVLFWWDLATGKGLMKVDLGEAYVYTLACSWKGLIAVGAADGTIRLYEVSTGRRLREQEPAGHAASAAVRHIAFSVDGRRIASLGDELDLPRHDLRV